MAGDLLRLYLMDKPIRVAVARDYALPAYADEKTLVIAASYSGNTEEALEAFAEAKKRGAEVWAVCSGGMLAEAAKHCILIPKGHQPRASIGYLFFSMLGLLHNSGIVSIANTDLNEMLRILGDTTFFDEEGERLAKSIGKRMPIFYASSRFYPIVYRCKTQVNENAKRLAIAGEIPEMNHNELVAFESIERSRHIVVMLHDEQDYPAIRRRFSLCRAIVEERVDVELMNTRGTGLLARMFSALHLGDWLSYHLAIRDRTDPTPVAMIEQLKKRLRGEKQ